MKQATIITGGSRGIGLHIARRMWLEGPIVLVGRTQDSLQKAAEELRKSGAEVDYVVGDIANPETAEHAVDCVLSHNWLLQNLVANAGIARGGQASTFPQEVFSQIVDVNIKGTMWMIQSCLPSMIARRSGSICVISSIAGISPPKRDCAYACSKAAQIALAQSLAKEVGQYGITVVPICPNFVWSDMTERTISGLTTHQSLSRDEAVAKIAATSSQKRILEPGEVAEVVAQVCSGMLKGMHGSPLIMGA
jgi:NAD(P)-dependent dehydrogenase (short-subunit alcohol dehydrogenase family)